MRNLQRVCGAIVLTCLLALPAFAGHIATPLAPPDPAPAPSSATAATETGTVGVAGNTETDADGTASDSLTEAVLNFMSSLLTLL